jgi:hypothetical protein
MVVQGASDFPGRRRSGGASRVAAAAAALGRRDRSHAPVAYTSRNAAAPSGPCNGDIHEPRAIECLDGDGEPIPTITARVESGSASPPVLRGRGSLAGRGRDR